ncbi:hypothetical protein ACFFF7_05385 [Novosphingobium aquiterrae]|uniref:DUF2946 domain-containing protein n=1 Tax=Novosphingobium aquiterrae TaxID=624388 RepID=A0ABV6PG75_9SPHN
MTALRRLPPSAALLVLALAVLARLALPSGWMPVAHAGEIKIMLCSGAGPVAVSLDLGKGTAPQTPRDPCPYGVASAAPADLPPPIALPDDRHWPEVPAFAAPHAARLVAWRATRPPARGPPHRA